ncbi:TetR/AcrR family transcriptional regulator [Sphingosinicella terrae]|uniref:TetR/AcrR family transcriptional regulator n=1 Tax=Sphingosinicella terrae TaxID=2172047 RepID=UPI000E0D6BBE|nr:TetR/AcrR family transcriptional regulator [Sphingosinicella terrae]
MADVGKEGRTNQKRRTRKALLEAASRLMREGRDPTLEEVAETALVSRATAYRYFPGVEPLLIEAALDVAMPGPELFAGDPGTDPADRVLRADAAVQDMVRSNETALRRMLIHALQRSLGDEGAEPVRQNRRTPLIEAALAPIRSRLEGPPFDRLTRTLALIVGTESTIVFKDVLQLSDAEAGDARRWAIEVLIGAALGEDGQHPAPSD